GGHRRGIRLHGPRPPDARGRADGGGGGRARSCHTQGVESMDTPRSAAAGTPIELFAIGTELVLGRIQDTNSYWMAQRITELGGNLRRVTQLVDDLDQITEALSDSLRRGTGIIITTGGLGPTPDDLPVPPVAPAP